MNKAELFCGRSVLKSAGDICVKFVASGPGQNHHIGPYPAFWTFDQREADLYIKLGQPHLQALDTFWQSRQFGELDKLFQEIEDATLKQIRLGSPADKPLDTSASEFQSRNQ